MLLTKNHIFVGHLGFHATEKNAQHLQTGIVYIGFGLSTYYLTENNEKNIIYVEKQGCLTCSPD